MKKALWLTGVIIPVFSSIDQLSVNLLPCTVVWAFAANAAKTNADKICPEVVYLFALFRNKAGGLGCRFLVCFDLC